MNLWYSSASLQGLLEVPQPRSIQYQGCETIVSTAIEPANCLGTTVEHTAIVIMASTASSVAIAMEIIAALGMFSP